MRKLEGKLFLPHQNNIGDQNKTKQKKRRGGGMGEMWELGSGGFILG